MFYVCGFNGFNQISKINESINLEDKCCITDLHLVQGFSPSTVCFSWSNAVLLEGDSVMVFGFIGGLPNQAVHLRLPGPGTPVQVSSTRQRVVVVTREGDCWTYHLGKQEWRDLGALLGVEQGERVTLSRAACSETMVVLLSRQGVAYSVPNRLSPEGMRVKEIALGAEHGLLLTDDGELYAWGEGTRGQLGTGCLDSSESLVPVAALQGLQVVKIAAGGWHSAAITNQGDLYCWGWNKQGQLGQPLKQEDENSGVNVLAVPTPVNWPDQKDVNVVDVACGTSHTVAKLDDGTIWACGWNRYGQLSQEGIKTSSKMTLIFKPQQSQEATIICGAWNTSLIIRNTVS